MDSVNTCRTSTSCTLTYTVIMLNLHYSSGATTYNIHTVCAVYLCIPGSKPGCFKNSHHVISYTVHLQLRNIHICKSANLDFLYTLYIGELFIIVFDASWCGHCVRFVSKYNSLAEKSTLQSKAISGRNGYPLQVIIGEDLSAQVNRSDAVPWEHRGILGHTRERREQERDTTDM